MTTALENLKSAKYKTIKDFLEGLKTELNPIRAQELLQHHKSYKAQKLDKHHIQQSIKTYNRVLEKLAGVDADEMYGLNFLSGSNLTSTEMQLVITQMPTVDGMVRYKFTELRKVLESGMLHQVTEGKPEKEKVFTAEQIKKMIKKEIKHEELEFVRQSTNTGTGGQNSNTPKPLCITCWYYGHESHECKTKMDSEKYKKFRESERGIQRQKDVEA